LTVVDCPHANKEEDAKQESEIEINNDQEEDSIPPGCHQGQRQ